MRFFGAIRARPLTVSLSVLVLAIGFSGCMASGENDPPPRTPVESDAASFVLDRFAEWKKQQYGDAWAHLHPAQQTIVPRELFTSVYTGQFNGWMGAFRPNGEIIQKNIRIPGTDVDAQAVIVPVELEEDFGEGEFTATRHVPVIRIGGRWTWILPEGYPQDFQRIGNVGGGTPFGSDV